MQLMETNGNAALGEDVIILGYTIEYEQNISTKDIITLII